MTNLHWAISAFDKIVEFTNKDGYEDYRAHFMVDIQIEHASSEEEAIEIAKKIIKRKHYHVRMILECHCLANNAEKSRQLELNREQIKLFKKITKEE